jgi:AbrB family looped-hinge helix DNA binding protein
MRTTIDAGGRVVIPKPVRERLGLVPGAEEDVV